MLRTNLSRKASLNPGTAKMSALLKGLNA
jgi:hypothetical protein